MHALLVGSCDAEPAVRASCLACLAHVCSTLRFGVHPWAVEVLQVVEAAVGGETDEQSRVAACHVLALVLGALGSSALSVLPSRQLASLQVRLRILRDSDAAAADELLMGHVCAALSHMRELGESLLGAGGGGEGSGLSLRLPGVSVPSESLSARTARIVALD